LDTEQKSHKRFLLQSWLELEQEFRKGNINPQHENDVVCYLYHALAKRYKKKGFPLYLIKTEDTYNLRQGPMRPDLNLHDRVFVEVKMYPLRDYKSGWKRKQQGIKYTVDKLTKYVAHQKANSSVLLRYPILALWFYKKERGKNKASENHETLFISDELNTLLEKEKKRYSKKATILYGPRR
jgi:hypothetical protein